MSDKFSTGMRTSRLFVLAACALSGAAGAWSCSDSPANGDAGDAASDVVQRQEGAARTRRGRRGRRSVRRPDAPRGHGPLLRLRVAHAHGGHHHVRAALPALVRRRREEALPPSCRRTRRSTRPTWTIGRSRSARRSGRSSTSARTVVETRLLWKIADAQWWEVAYAWTADGTDAVAAPDGGVNALGTTHDIPSQLDCNACHSNVRDVLIGVSALQLGATDGDGTLGKLVGRGPSLERARRIRVRRSRKRRRRKTRSVISTATAVTATIRLGRAHASEPDEDAPCACR